MSSRGLAKQAVHFVAAKQLYELGVLDNTLLPVRPAIPDKIDAFFKALTSKSIPDEEEDGEFVEKSTAKKKEEDKSESENSNANAFTAAWYRKRVTLASVL